MQKAESSINYTHSIFVQLASIPHTIFSLFSVVFLTYLRFPPADSLLKTFWIPLCDFFRLAVSSSLLSPHPHTSALLRPMLYTRLSPPRFHHFLQFFLTLPTRFSQVKNLMENRHQWTPFSVFSSFPVSLPGFQLIRIFYTVICKTSYWHFIVRPAFGFTGQKHSASWLIMQAEKVPFPFQIYKFYAVFVRTLYLMCIAANSLQLA